MKYLLLTILSAILVTGNLYSQSSEGTDFWVGFMEHVNTNDNTKVLMITAKVNTSGTVTMPLLGWTSNFDVVANEVKIVYLPWNAETVGSEAYEKTGIHVVANDVVSVYAHQYANNRSEAALVLPTAALGNEYLVMSYFGFLGNNGDVHPSEFLIIGIEEETKITITPSDVTKNGRLAGTPFSITLGPGDSYQVQSAEASDGDLTGSEILGDKNFAVFAGNKWTQVPRNCTYMDNLYEQMYPVETWGRKFVTVPSENVVYDIFRIMAAEDGTKIYQDNALIGTIDRGEFLEERVNGFSTYFEGDKPILIAKFNVGASCSGQTGGVGDPSMVFLNSVEQTRDSITLYSSAFENISDNFIDLIVRTADTAEVYLDGNKIANSFFVVVSGNSDYSYAQVRVNSGTHNLYNNGCGIIATAYGYGDFESYSYSGGANFKKINVNPIPDGGCLNDTIFFTTGLPEGKAMVLWDFGDGTFSDELEPGHIYNDLGSYDVELVVFDLCLQTVDTINQTIYVTLRDTIMTGDDFEVCTGTEIQLSSTDVSDARYEWTGPNGFFSEEQNPLLIETISEMSGEYSVVGIVSGCATYPAIQVIDIHPVPFPYLGNDTTICYEGPIFLDGGEWTEYRWQDGNSAREYTVSGPNIYVLNVTDDIGCQGLDSVEITERCPPALFMPTGFTPNDDGFNDIFKISATDMIRFEISIYNRWGQLVFRTSNPDEHWDGSLASGRKASEGVYVWHVNYDWPGIDGFTYQRAESGTVTLIR